MQLSVLSLENDPNSERDKVVTNIKMKVLPREEYCKLNPVPKKTKLMLVIRFEQSTTNSIWFCPLQVAKQTPGTINSYGC